MAVGEKQRQRARRRRARVNLISRTARLWGRQSRELAAGLDGVLQRWISAVLRSFDEASGTLVNEPALPAAFERILRKGMVHALAQGYWLQHVYMQECSGRKPGGRIELSDTGDDMRKKLEALLKKAKVTDDPAWASVIPADAVVWIEGYTPKLAGVVEQDVLARVRDAVRASMMSGTSLRDRKAAVRGELPAIQAMGKNRAEMIARTEVTRADTMGRLINMKQNPDVLGVEFCAVLDARTTDICQTRNGLVMRMDDPRLAYNTPPLHVNCRSLLLAATIYDHPDGLLTSHEFDELEGGKQRDADVAAVKKVLDAVPVAEPAPKPKPEPAPVAEELIRGVPRSEIDRLRGKRGHAKRPEEWGAKTVRADYANVGINITGAEAEYIASSIHSFSGQYYDVMRRAYKKRKAELALSEVERSALAQYDKVIEYTKIAPTYRGAAKTLHRGISAGEYAEKLRGFAVGDTFDLEMASSFSTSEQVAFNFSDFQGVMLHAVDNSWKDAPSVSGFSEFFKEREVLVSDRMWTVTEVKDGDYGIRHIFLKRIQT